jgi:hypothetical protein
VTSQNVTLSIPKQVLQKAKYMAVEKNTSLSGLLTEYIKNMVEQDDRYKTGRMHHLSVLEKGFEMGTKDSVSWERDELHVR